MLKWNDLRLGARQLVTDPGYSAVVLVGMALAVAAAVLVGTLMDRTLRTDRDVPDLDRALTFEFRGNRPNMNEQWVPASPYALRSALREAQAPMAAIARVHSLAATLSVDGKLTSVEMAMADPELVEVFGLKAIEGDLAATLASPDGIALTTETAAKVFGSAKAIGKTLRIGDQSFVVRAIVPVRHKIDSVLHYEALASFDAPFYKRPPMLLETYFRMQGRVFGRLAAGARAEQITALAQAVADKSPEAQGVSEDWKAGGRKVVLVRAMPLAERPLHGAGSDGRRLGMLVLGAAALAMLALASVNYVNLTSVRTLRRQREIGMRKALGASPPRLVAQFMAESLVVAVAAGALGLLLAWLVAPVLADVVDQRIDIGLLTPTLVATTLGGCALLGLLTGAYPAWVAHRVPCAESLAGRSHSESASGRWMRRALTALQFAAAVALSAVTLIVLWQARHAEGLNMGFTRERVLAVDLPAVPDKNKGAALRETLLRQPGVTGAWSANDAFGRNWSVMHFTIEKSDGPGDVTTRGSSVNPGMFELLGIPVLAGRLEERMDTEADKVIVLDRAAAKAYGFASPQDAVGKTVGQNDEKLTVVAVVENTRLENAREAAKPKAYLLRTDIKESLHVRGSDLPTLRRALETAWSQHFPERLPRVESLEHYIGLNYKEDRRMGLLIGVASVIALALAGFGVYALAAYTVRHRTREIVIRKLHGAGAASIARLLAREFGLLLLVGAAIGLPLAWLAGERVMSQFVERAPIGAWPFLIAPAVALAVTALATLRHTWSAMALRPALALQG
jgi:putative ABC transport system permease protein